MQKYTVPENVQNIWRLIIILSRYNFQPLTEIWPKGPVLSCASKEAPHLQYKPLQLGDDPLPSMDGWLVMSQPV